MPKKTKDNIMAAENEGISSMEEFYKVYHHLLSHDFEDNKLGQDAGEMDRLLRDRIYDNYRSIILEGNECS